MELLDPSTVTSAPVEFDESKLTEAYSGAMRVTIHIRNNYDRAIRVVLDPKVDTWESFAVDVKKKLRLGTSGFHLERGATKEKVAAIADIK
jgi:hypothetical protein